MPFTLFSSNYHVLHCPLISLHLFLEESFVFYLPFWHQLILLFLLICQYAYQFIIMLVISIISE